MFENQSAFDLTTTEFRNKRNNRRIKKIHNDKIHTLHPFPYNIKIRILMRM